MLTHRVLAEAFAMTGAEDIQSGLSVARIGGELAAIQSALSSMPSIPPFLSNYLSSRSQALIELGSQHIVSSMSKNALAGAAERTAEIIGELGEQEVEEGVVQLEASEEVGEEAEMLRGNVEGLVTSAGGLNDKAVDSFSERPLNLSVSTHSVKHCHGIRTRQCFGQARDRDDGTRCARGYQGCWRAGRGHFDDRG